MGEGRAASAILATLMAGSAAAADVPIPVRKAPVPVAAYDWTGIYIGGHVGAGFSHPDWTLGGGPISEAGDGPMVGGPLRMKYQPRKKGAGGEGGGFRGKPEGRGVFPAPDQNGLARE